MKKLSSDFIKTARIIDKSPISISYEIDDETAVKLNLYKTTVQEIEQLKSNSKNAVRMGIPVVFSFDVVQCGENYGIIYENLQSKTLGDLILENPENFDKYVDDFVDLSRKLAAVHVGYNAFRSIKEIHEGYCEQFVQKGFYTREEADAVGRMLAAIPEQDTFVHSALRPSILRYSDDELTIYGLRDAGYGHPIFDVGGTVLTLWSPALTGDDKRVKWACGLDCATAVRFQRAYIRKYFNCTTDEEVEKIERLMIFVAMQKRFTVPAIFKTADENKLREVQEDSRKNFLPYIDQWIADMGDYWERFL